MFGGDPNIEGLAQWVFGGYVDQFDPVFNGALYASPNTKMSGTTDGASYSLGHPGIGFDASKDNATYSGAKVQVSALQVLACIKI